MAGDILYFLHRHFRAICALGLVASGVTLCATLLALARLLKVMG